MSPHPSPFALDTFHVDSTAQPKLAEHITACAQCQDYLGSYPSVAMTPSIAQLRATPRRSRWWWAMLAAPAMASVLFFTVPSTENGIRAKGLPSVAVYVKHGADVALWDGERSIAAGDSLRLRVTGAGYHFVAVEDAQGDVLYQGDIGAELLLPVSFAADAAGDEEKLVVILTSKNATPETMDKARTTPLRGATVWSTILVLPKTAP